VKSKDKRQQMPSMVEDGATERLKKRAQDLGLIVNAGLGRSTAPKSKGATKTKWKAAKKGSKQ
jgi:hypothetical protein